jgi:uncharacterized protein (TIGR02611 family)
MESFKRYWKSVPAAVRKPLVGIIGTFFIIIGLLLVPLPGPGWLVVFLGLAVLATEFAIAEKVRAYLVNELQQWLAKAKKKFKRQAK